MKKDNREITTDRELREILVALGFAFAQSDSELSIIEASTKKVNPKEIEDFGDLNSLMNAKPRFKPKYFSGIVDKTVEENLAMAARNGSQISSEILEKMRKDREEAERRRKES